MVIFLLLLWLFQLVGEERSNLGPCNMGYLRLEPFASPFQNLHERERLSVNMACSIINMQIIPVICFHT